MNTIKTSIRPIKDILKINSDENFHGFFLEHAVIEYQKLCKRKKIPMGKVVALGANHREAKILSKFQFREILITGITNPNKELQKIIKSGKNISYKKENIEKLSLPSKSCDLVLAKECIHHVPRPALALYEMLRVCKNAAIFIEPYDSKVGKILEALKISSQYEKNQEGNLKFRDNFVYRWDKNQLKKTLNSYYLESGYSLNLTFCWLSNRYNAKYPIVSKLFGIVGWIMSSTLREGNYVTAIITPGKDIPEDVE